MITIIDITIIDLVTPTQLLTENNLLKIKNILDQ